MINIWVEVLQMKRNVDMNQISDGKLYEINDMVKAGCDGCNGCSACCSGMGQSVVLDPLDVYRMTENLGISFEELLSGAVELNVVDGIILPNLKMSGSEEKCSFLDDEGRCRIHSFRPGICRLFPLGRYYENREHKYFLQVHECPKENKTKVKVKNWIDTPDIKTYEEFVNNWHYMLEDLQETIGNASDEALVKQISMHVLQNFYINKYLPDANIFEQINDRIKGTYMRFIS